jgi:RNA polymerase sigma-70 factor, ECF subfamily
LSNRIRGQQRDPVSVGLPSSGSEPPRTPRDLDRAMDFERVAPQMLALLTDDQRDVVELVLIELLSHSEAADVLGIALGTVKSRVMAAKHRMLELLEQLLHPSQRKTT